MRERERLRRRVRGVSSWPIGVMGGRMLLGVSTGSVSVE